VQTSGRFHVRWLGEHRIVRTATDMSMVVFLFNRLLHAVAVVFGVVSLTFILLHLAGDPLAGLMPPGATPEVEAQIRHAYGLDRPILTQYVEFVTAGLHGDFGDSWRQGRPALGVVLERLPFTLMLAALAIGLAMVVGTVLGVLAAARPGSPWDGLARSTALLGQAIPAFWLGTMLILFFAVDLHWLPSSGWTGPGSLILPALALAAFPTATLTRLVRASLMDVLAADYIRTARGKGLPLRQILFGHALRNAALPALAFTGLQAGFLLGGAVIVEGVFAFPGVGGLALDAVSTRDIPLVAAFVYVVAILIVIANTVTGITAALIDPRLREDGLAHMSPA
jgi:peptide/nickel transport system permease protein